MFKENHFLEEIFNIIVRQVLKNLIRSKFMQEEYSGDNSDEYFIQEIDNLDKVIEFKATVKKIMTTQLNIPIKNSQLEDTLDSIIGIPIENSQSKILLILSLEIRMIIMLRVLTFQMK
jgi:hypothetical protein